MMDMVDTVFLVFLGVMISKLQFSYCRDILWSDVIDKIDNEFKDSSYKLLIEPTKAPTFVLHNSYFPGTLGKVFNRVNEEMNTKVLHVYTSLGSNSLTFGRHNDDTDVLIIQAIGQMEYEIEGNIIILNPGEGIIIKEGVYHTPIVKEPRVTLSFSWS